MKRHFSPDLFDFLEDLAAHNDRDWFQANKDRYERAVVEPALAFISDFAPGLRAISRWFDAVPKRVGGSMFRIYRDTRFSPDKRPYKTHVGLHFRHRDADSAYAPGFYLHLEPGQVFMGMGIWHPPAPALRAIREHLAAHPDDWRAVRDDAALRRSFRHTGDRLARPPRGFEADHPWIEDLKRKDFVISADLDEETACGDDFLDLFTARCRDGAPFVRFLCLATGASF